VPSLGHEASGRNWVASIARGQGREKNGTKGTKQMFRSGGVRTTAYCPGLPGFQIMAFTKQPRANLFPTKSDCFTTFRDLRGESNRTKRTIRKGPGWV
jgi:hypothetical protein